MKVLSGLICALLLPGPASWAEGGLERAALEVSALVAERPEGVADIFDKSLFRQISLEELTGTLAGIYRENGAVSRVVFVSSSAGSGHFYFDTAAGFRVPAALSLDRVSGRVDKLFLGPAYKKSAVLTAVREKLAALPGKTGFLARRLGDEPENLEALNEDVPLAVGDSFKLYLLGALVRAGGRWGKVIRLKAADKSLPAGRLNAWPDGAPLTTHTLAALMISENDNTAADALASALGRRAIEADLAALGHAGPGRLKPFLTTSEMLKLKAGTEAALKYLNLPAGEKYAFLSSLAGAPLPAEGQSKSSFGLSRLEWFASPSDLCRLAAYFAEKKDEKALEILALNPGPANPRSFAYAGYQGGSGPGALSATWLLKNKKKEWYCLSASWNDEAGSASGNEFIPLMLSALDALAAEDR